MYTVYCGVLEQRQATKTQSNRTRPLGLLISYNVVNSVVIGIFSDHRNAHLIVLGFEVLAPIVVNMLRSTHN